MSPGQWRHEPRCEKWMPLAQELCARHRGHRGPCRTRYALDNAYRATLGHDRGERMPWRAS